jgi:hypothetical protein
VIGGDNGSIVVSARHTKLTDIVSDKEEFACVEVAVETCACHATGLLHLPDTLQAEAPANSFESHSDSWESSKYHISCKEELVAQQWFCAKDLPFIINELGTPNTSSHDDHVDTSLWSEHLTMHTSMHVTSPDDLPFTRRACRSEHERDFPALEDCDRVT